jgi:hypothetical protein
MNTPAVTRRSAIQSIATNVLLMGTLATFHAKSMAYTVPQELGAASYT